MKTLIIRKVNQSYNQENVHKNSIKLRKYYFCNRVHISSLSHQSKIFSCPSTRKVIYTESTLTFAIYLRKSALYFVDIFVLLNGMTGDNVSNVPSIRLPPKKGCFSFRDLLHHGLPIGCVAKISSRYVLFFQVMRLINFPNCEGFHLFCKIIRFFATEPVILIHFPWIFLFLFTTYRFTYFFELFAMEPYRS